MKEEQKRDVEGREQGKRKGDKGGRKYKAEMCII